MRGKNGITTFLRGFEHGGGQKYSRLRYSDEVVATLSVFPAKDLLWRL